MLFKIPPGNLPSRVEFDSKLESFEKEFRRTEFIAVERIKKPRNSDVKKLVYTQV